MLSALFFLQFHSVKNRTVARLKRLKQPKYLAGAIVGGLYFYFYFFRYLFGFGPRGSGATGGEWVKAMHEYPELFQAGGALLLLLVILLAWLIPHERAALAFSEAEVAFLFPAPFSRRTLINYKLLRSQFAIFFTVLLLTLVTNRLGGRTWIQMAGWWLLLSTLNLHMLGCSFARTMLLDRGIGNWQRRLVLLLALGILGGSLFVWARHNLPPLDLSQASTLSYINDYVQSVLGTGPVRWLLYPFKVAVRPYLAADASAFYAAAGPALLLLALHYVWVVRSDVAFEEASVEASRKLADKVAAIRAGNWQAGRKELKPRRAPFWLKPLGAPFVALFWKNLIGSGRVFTLRMLIALAVFAICMGIGFGQSGRGQHGPPLATILGFAGLGLLVWFFFLGPQFLRQDFRQDLPFMDMLKMYPMRGWQIALGELLAPAVILTCVQWVLLLGSALLLLQTKAVPLPLPEALAGGLSGAFLIPLFNVITLLIPNAAVLLFPAWFQTGKDGAAQGIEATGQRLIFMLGQMLAFLLALLPVALTWTVAFLAAKWLLNLPVALLIASLAAALVLAGEAAFGVVLLGRFFEKFDVAAEGS